MSFDTDFVTIDLNDIPADLVASSEVRQAGIRIFTVPEGVYNVTVDELKVRRTPDHFQYNPGRAQLNFKLKTEEGKTIFMDCSWEPSDNDTGIDTQNELYSQLEQSLNMYGAPVREVVQAAETATFQVKVVESCRTTVGALPEEKQVYYVENKGLGESSEITFYIRAQDDDVRLHMAASGAKLRNYVKAIRAN